MLRTLNTELKDNLILLDLVVKEDAEFILQLRTDENLNKFLSTTDHDLSRQIEWIRGYKKREAEAKEFYFIIKDINNLGKWGTIRIYNIKGSKFTWGSWIIKRNAQPGAAIRAAFLLYDFAFYKLCLNVCEFDVRKKNMSVINFHKKMGAQVINEDDDNFYFIYTVEDYEKMFLYKQKIRHDTKSRNALKSSISQTLFDHNSDL